MTAIPHDVRYALRTMAKQPAFTAVVLLTLAAGIGATTAMFSVLYAVLLRPLPFAHPEQLVLLRTHYEPGGGNGPTSAPDYRDTRDMAKSFQSLAVMRFVIERTVNTSGEAERVRETSASVDFLKTLGVTPWRGRFFTPQEERGHVAVISYEYWQRRFGGRDDALGKTITVNGEADVIVGVMPPRFICLQQVDLWRPFEADGVAQGPRRAHNFYPIGRLREGVSLQQAQAELDTIGRQLAQQYPDSNKGTSLQASNLQSVVVRDYRTPLLVLMAAVLLVLLIACGNVAGLMLARGAVRRQELALRAALGASPGRLVRQLLTESLLLAVGGGLLGLVLNAALQQALLAQSVWAETGTQPTGSDWRVMLFAMAASLVTAVLCGVAPALAAQKADPAEDLKSVRTTTSREGVRLRNVLVAAQMALSVALLIGSGLLVKSLLRLQGANPGFDSTHLLTAEIALPPTGYSEPQKRAQFYRALQEDLRGRPGVLSVGLINYLPVRSPFNNVGVWASDTPPADRRDATVSYWRRVMPGYFETMRIPLLAGRTIQDSDEAGRSNVMVINDTLAKQIFPNRNPIGQWAVIDTMSDTPYRAEVIGVVGEEKIEGVASPQNPAMYISELQAPVPTMQIALRMSGRPEDATATLRSAVAALDKGVPVSGVRTMEEIIDTSLGGQRFSAQLLAGFAGIAVLLASIGLYGVLAFFVSQRTQEIGVRMALGASRGRVLAVVLRRGVLLVGSGIAIGVGLSLWATTLLKSLLFGVRTYDVMSFVSAVLALAAISLLACALPAWRASRIDPMVALRAE